MHSSNHCRHFSSWRRPCKARSAFRPTFGSSRQRARMQLLNVAFMKKLTVLGLVLSVFGIMTWLVWFRPVQEPGEEKKPEAEVPVHVATIARATLRRYVTAYGPVEPA